MTQKITAALHEVMSKVGYVQKRGKNQFHGYKYAGEADLLEVLRPAMVDAGLLLIPSVVDATGPDEYGNTLVRVEYTLAHKDGEVWPDKMCAIGCGNDKNSKGGIGDKGVYKGLTGANKYMLFKLFQIETGDDPEGSENDPPKPEPRERTTSPFPPKQETKPEFTSDPPRNAKLRTVEDWKAILPQWKKNLDSIQTVKALNDWIQVLDEGHEIAALVDAWPAAGDKFNSEINLKRKVMAERETMMARA